MEQTNDELIKLQKEYKDQSDDYNDLKVVKDTLENEKDVAVRNKQQLELQLVELTAKLDKSTQETKNQLKQIKELNTQIQKLESSQAIAKANTKNPINTKTKETQLTKEIINVKAKSYNEIQDMKMKVESIELESSKKIQELESIIASHEKEQKSLRKLTKLGFKRVWSILMLTKLRESLKRN